MTDTVSRANGPIVDPLWPGPCLFVPSVLECLPVGKPNQNAVWAATRTNYDRVKRFLDPSPRPFEARASSDPPRTGAHLLMTLPAAITLGRQTEAGELEFHPVPNRWLVARFLSTTPGQPPAITAWVLQSDFLGDAAEGSNPYPDPEKPGTVRYLGRAFSLSGWTNPAAPKTPVIRAAAPGDVTWAAVYDNVNNVLAFHDGLDGVASGTVAYAMLGWYQPAAFDPLLGVSDSPPAGFLTEEEWQALMDALAWGVGGEAGLAEARRDWEAWRALNPMTDGPAIPEAQKNLASQTLVHGMVHGLAWKGPGVAYPRAPILSGKSRPAVAVGGTAVEAMAAWMAAQCQAPELEDLLLALQEDMVFDYATDRPAFEAQSLANRFGKTDGGSLWGVRRTDDADEGGAGNGQALQELPLSAAQSDALTALNDAQARLDATRRLIASKTAALFGDACKLTKITAASSYHAPTQRAIAATRDDIVELERQRAREEAEHEERRSELLALLGASYALNEVAAPPFFAPMAPAVMISGACQDTRFLPPGADGGEDRLFCRFTGQTVRGLMVSDPQTGRSATISAGDLVKAAAIPAGTGVPKEVTGFLIECLFFDPANARWLATLFFPLAGLPDPTAEQIDRLAAVIAAQQATPWAATAADGLDETVLGVAAGFDGVVPMKRAVLPWTPPWTPLYLDWRIAWRPSAPNPAGMLADWVPDGFDYGWDGHPADGETYSVDGRASVGTQLSRGLAVKLRRFLETSHDLDRLPGHQRALLEEAAARIGDYDIITENMAGLEPWMVMLDSMICRITNKDPEVQRLIDGAPTAVPIPPSVGEKGGFFPIRAGHFSITQMWVVDAFGQVLFVTNPGETVIPIRSRSVHTPPVGKASNAALIQLAPRVVQPTRLSLRLLSARDDRVPSNAADRTSPIAGWVLPNHLDGGLLVFDAEGLALGEVLPVENDGGSGLRWESAPGRSEPLGAPPDIADPHLSGFIDGLLATQRDHGAGALGELLDLIDVTLWRSIPQGQPSSGALAVLLGQPIAVVRADIAIGLDGDPLYDQDWAKTGKRDDRGFPAVPLATCVGDAGFSGNGALGCFLDDDYGRLYPARGFAPSLGLIRRALADRRDEPREALRRALSAIPHALGGGAAGGGYLAARPDFPLTASGARRRLTLLVDPRGVIPAACGILPVVTAALPAGPVSAAMNRLVATFRMGPLLVDPERVRMPLPSEVGGRWSWVERAGVTVWRSDRDLQGNDPKALLPATPPDVREGWLALNPGRDRA
ncbi:hypothetical protein J2847_005934 [Azospirillum agricola]|uniref:hypothetical protein n=1 Tax=Azospirillum agricola TaxID=1720247 RepID=UPI001AE5B686|nr:hypothetical protein [Azospirillum agricola]MBP2232603.1 hypothetical protein [Azospirillum agricola]